MPNRDDNRESQTVWPDDFGGTDQKLPAQPALSLENVANMFGVPPMTLRYYELRGLIKRRHRQDGVRVYGWADCERLAFIIKCRKADIMLADIIRVIEATDEDASPLRFRTGQETCTALVERLEQRSKVLGDAMSELNHMYALLTNRLLGDAKPPRQR